MEILYILFAVLFLVSLVTAGHRRFPDTQSCIRRDGYCKAKCTKIGSRNEVELGTCKNGRQKCCRPKRLEMSTLEYTRHCSHPGSDCKWAHTRCEFIVEASERKRCCLDMLSGPNQS